MTALTGVLLSTCLAAPAAADCPAAPLASADDMVVSFIASQGGTQAAPSTLFASTVKEGMLVYDDTNNALKLCDGTNWVALQAGTALAAGTVTGAVQFRGPTGLLSADDTNFIWDDTNNRLGIGTATPANPLHVTGNAEFGSVTVGGLSAITRTGGYLRLNATGAAEGILLFQGSSPATPAVTITNPDGLVGVGTTTPHASALLDVTSTAKGFLPPRMTTTDVGNIATPADGLIVYDTTTDTLKLRANGAWSNLAFGGAGGGASAAGNAGEVQFNDGSGGLSADSNLFWDNTNKRLGVGNATPSTAVEVTGTVKSSGPLWSSFGNTGTHRGIILENYDDTANTNGVDVAAKLGGTEFQGINWLQETAWVSGDADGDKDVMLQFGVLTDNVATIPMVLRASGNVGIGTAGPDAKLHVAGGVKIGDDTDTCPGSGNVKLGTLRFNSGNFEVCQSGGWAAAAGGASGVGGAGYVQISDGSGGLTTSGATAGQEFFWDNTNKRLGIGTATPAHPLHVAGAIHSTATTGQVTLGNDAGGSVSLGRIDNTASSPYIDFNSGSTSVDYDARIQSIGGNGTDGNSDLSIIAANVGIGTTSPVAKLDVSGGVKLGDQTTCTNGTHNGTLRWNSNNLEICTASGWATITGPGVDVINGSALSSGTFPQANGSTIYSSGGSYDLGSMAVEKGVYIWTVYNCAGQLSYSSGSGTSIQIVGATVIHSSSTWAKLDTAPDSTCGSIYTGVFKSNGTGTAAVRVSSASGSVLTKPSATAFGVYANKIAGGGGVYGGGAGSGDFLADGSIPMTGDLDMDGNDVIGAGAVGIGTDTPVAALDVVGGVKLGDQTTCTNGTHNGTLRYNAGALQICQASGWVNVGGSSGPYLRLEYSAGTLDRANIIPFSTVESGGGATWASNRYTASVAGLYMATANIRANGQHNMLVTIRKNGSSIMDAYGDASQAGKQGGASGSVVTYLNAGDYIDFYYNHDTGGVYLLRAFASIAYLGSGAGGGGSGDLMADGSIPMTGDLDMDGNDIIGAGAIGIGTDTPVAALDVVGGVKIGNQATCTNGTHNGTLRYNSGNLEICQSTGWEAIPGGAAQVGFVATSSTTITTSTATLGGYTETRDDGNVFNPTTGTFTAPANGWYQFTARVFYSDANSAYPEINITAGGTQICREFSQVNDANYIVSCAGGVYLTSGQTAVVNASAPGGATAGSVYFSGYSVAGGGAGGGSGDMLADGSVPMTGDLDMDGNDIIGAGAIGVGTDTPHASSILDLTSTSQGFLPPRMSEAQRDAIASPATGLMIFNTDSGRPEFYGGTGWVPMGLIFDGSSSMAAAPSASYLDAIGVNQNGTYWLKPDGYGSAAFQAFIDFDGTASGITDPGPWVRIAYAQDYYSQASPWENTGVSTSPGASSLLFGTEHTAAEVNAILSTCTESRQSFTSAGYKSVGWTYSGSPKNVGYMTVLNWWGGASGSNSNSTAGAAYWPASLDYSFSNINTFNNTGTDETDANDAVWRTNTIYIRDTTATYLPITRISHSDVDGTDEGRHFPLLSSGSHTWCK